MCEHELFYYLFLRSNQKYFVGFRDVKLCPSLQVSVCACARACVLYASQNSISFPSNIVWNAVSEYFLSDPRLLLHSEIKILLSVKS